MVNCFVPQMVFADRASIPFYNPEFIRDSQASATASSFWEENPRQNIRDSLPNTDPPVAPLETGH